jgi:hypothetical protein
MSQQQIFRILCSQSLGTRAAAQAYGLRFAVRETARNLGTLFQCNVLVTTIATGAEEGVMSRDFFENVRSADAFLAHISDASSFVELGYAAAVLGWHRVLAVVDSDFAEANALPANMKARVLGSYSLLGDGRSDVDESRLFELLFGLLKSTQDDAQEMKAIQDLAVLHREEDLERTRRLLSAIDWPEMVRTVRSLPERVDAEFWRSHSVFAAMITEDALLFHDSELAVRLRTIQECWDDVQSYAARYRVKDDEISLHGHPEPFEQRQGRKFARAAISPFISAVAKMLTEVIERFPEIAVEEITRSRSALLAALMAFPAKESKALSRHLKQQTCRPVTVAAGEENRGVQN